MLRRLLTQSAGGVVVGVLAAFLVPALALATSTGACTASAQTPRGTVDLASASVLHVTSAAASA